jgi:hypothetical protein
MQDTLRDESKAITISSVSLIVALLAVLMSFLASQSAMKAELRAEMQTTEIQELRDEVAVLEVRVMNAENRSD